MSDGSPDPERMQDRRLAVAMLISINAIGLLASMIVIGLAASKDPQLAVHVTTAIRHSMRMFVAGAFLPILPAVFCWIEIDLQVGWSSRILKWSTNVVMLASGVLFLVAAWNLPHGLLRGLQGL